MQIFRGLAPVVRIYQSGIRYESLLK